VNIIKDVPSISHIRTLEILLEVLFGDFLVYENEEHLNPQLVYQLLPPASTCWSFRHTKRKVFWRINYVMLSILVLVLSCL